ncbi:MAG: hypothetical protein ACM3P1_12775 [Candidatus Saccharibacteria bacterium]
MKTKITYLIIAFTVLLFGACKEDPVPGPPGRNGQDATVYYSEWFTPGTWAGTSGDWYFNASAPDLTQDIVEKGVILAYVWLGDDIYQGMAVRPLPAYATGANWDFLIPDYGSIEFTCDMVSKPATSTNKFRFVAIPGTIPALKSASIKDQRLQLKNMSYQEVCRLLNIPE